MPAAVTTLRLDDNLATPSVREWVATATVGSGDYAAGATVTVTVTMTSSGATPPGADETFQLIVKNTAGTTVRTITLTSNTASQSTSFVLTANGSAGGGDRCGVFEMVLRAARTSLVAYDVSSDNSTNSPPAGFATEHARGWVRGTTSNTMALSNVSAGGAKTQPAAFNESIFVRSVLAHQSIANYTLTLGVTDSLGGPAQTGASSSTTSATRDVTLSGIVDNRFSAASRTFTSSVSIPNDSLTGAAWTVLTTTNDTITADPRLTLDHHLQLNNNTYDSALGVTSRLTADLGFATFKVTDARAQAVSGITCTHSLQDAAGLSSAAFSVSEATGATGRPSSMQTWDEALPGGSWTHTTTITAPSDATGLGSPATETWTLLAPNPYLRVICGAGPAAAADSRHWKPGDILQVGGGLINTDTRKLVTVSGTPSAIIARQNATTGRVEYLDSTFAWNELAIDGSEAAYAHSMVRADTIIPTADTKLWFFIYSGDTSGWGHGDITALVIMADSSGTPYSFTTFVHAYGDANNHDGYSLDGPGLALTGGLTFR